MRNLATGLVQHTIASPEGTFAVVGLPSGIYVVGASADATVQVTLAVASSAPLGEALEQMQVTADCKGLELPEVRTSEVATIDSLPDGAFSSVVVDQYNAQCHFEYDHIRDFLILHNCAGERSDSQFWNYCRTMSNPEGLKAKINLFRDSGRFFRNAKELFALTSWVQVMLGQRITPRKHHPAADLLGEKEVAELVDGIKAVLAKCVAAMPSHQAFIDRHCKAAA